MFGLESQESRKPSDEKTLFRMRGKTQRTIPTKKIKKEL